MTLNKCKAFYTRVLGILSLENELEDEKLKLLPEKLHFGYAFKIKKKNLENGFFSYQSKATQYLFIFTINN